MLKYIYIALSIIAITGISKSEASLRPEIYNQQCVDNYNSSIGDFDCRGGQLTQSEAHSFCTSFLIGTSNNIYMDCMGSFLPFVQDEQSSRGCSVSSQKLVNWGFSIENGTLNQNCSGLIPAGNYRSNQTVSVETQTTNDNFIGSANFVCDNGVFRVDNSTSICTEVAKICDPNGQVYSWNTNHIGNYLYEDGYFVRSENNNGGSLDEIERVNIEDTDWFRVLANRDKNQAEAEIKNILESVMCESVVSNHNEMNMYENITLIPNQGKLRTNIQDGFNFNNFILVNNGSVNPLNYGNNLSYYVDFCYDGNIGSDNNWFSRGRFEQYNNTLHSAGIISGSAKDSLLSKKCATYPVDCREGTLEFTGAEGGICQFDTRNMKHGNDPLRITVKDDIGTRNNFIESRDHPTHGYATVSCFNGNQFFDTTPVCYLDPECKTGDRTAEATTGSERVFANQNNFGKFGQDYSNEEIFDHFKTELEGKCENLGFRGNAILDEDSFSIESIERNESEKEDSFYWQSLGINSGLEAYGVADQYYREVRFEGNGLLAVARNRQGVIVEEKICNNSNVGSYIDEETGDDESCTSRCAHGRETWRCMSNEVVSDEPEYYASSIEVSAECVYIENPNFTSQDLCEVGEHEGFVFNPSNTGGQPYFEGSYYTWNCGNGLKVDGESYSCTGEDSNAGESVGVCGSNNTRTFNSLSNNNSNNCSMGSVSGFNSSNNETFNWSCNSGNSSTSCMAYKNASCGESNNGTFLNLKSSNSGNCGIGSVSDFGITGSGYTWKCNNGSSTVNCSANRNASCGLNNNGTMASLNNNNSHNCSIGSVTNFRDNPEDYTWICNNGNSSTSCMAYKNSTCGSNHGGTFASISDNNSNNCDIGRDNKPSVSGGVTTHTETFSWSCYNGISSSNCSAYRDPACGNANGITTASMPNDSARCGIGSHSNSGDNNTLWTWDCNNGDKTISCSAYKSPKCGSAHTSNGGGVFSSFPSNLSARCEIGSFVNDRSDTRGYYNWRCTNGSQSTNCNAYRMPSCGSTHQTTSDIDHSSNTASACATGEFANRGNDTNTIRWSCVVADNGGSERRNCFSYRTPSCGSANGQTTSGAPSSSSRCSSGTAEGFSTDDSKGVFTWRCNTGNGSPANCKSYKRPECGSANGSFTSSSPNSNLCNIGNASSRSRQGNNTQNDRFTWTCSNENNTNTASCSAPVTPSCGSGFYACSGGGSIDNNTWHATRAEWKCRTNSSTSGLCTRNKSSASENGVCGSAAGSSNSVSRPSLNLCSSGSATTVTGSATSNPQWSWACKGSPLTSERVAGTSSSCDTGRPSGSCGSINGSNRTSLSSSTSGLCSSGSVNNFKSTGTGWTWNCTLGGSASCSANVQASCGTHSGGTFSNPPSGNGLCGGTSSVSGSVRTLENRYEWTCRNSNGTHTRNCSATRDTSTPVFDPQGIYISCSDGSQMRPLSGDSLAGRICSDISLAGGLNVQGFTEAANRYTFEWIHSGPQPATCQFANLSRNWVEATTWGPICQGSFDRVIVTHRDTQESRTLWSIGYNFGGAANQL